MTEEAIEAEMTQTTNYLAMVDEFLGRHGACLPAHVLDFALDVRTVIAELTESLDRVPAGV